MTSFSEFTRWLTTELLAGPWEKQAVIDRFDHAAGRHAGWIPLIFRQIIAEFPPPKSPGHRALRRFLNANAALHTAWKKGARLRHRLLTSATMSPAASPPLTWPAPHLSTEGALCQWLELTPERLEWFADVHGRERLRPRGALRHYAYRWTRKPSGGLRLLETPKAKLKSLQRRILRELIDLIPVHSAAYGFVRGRSIRDFVAPHANQHTVLRLDLKDFFISVNASRIHALFQTVGYPEGVARILTGLCTNSVPSSVLYQPALTERFSGLRQTQYRTPHLPQGAPTSPALANLCAWRLDTRLAALAQRLGYQYSRYADDLLFSGPAMGKKFATSLLSWIGAIAIEEKFTINFQKTRIMRRSVRQHAAGLTLNARPNVRRKDYENLKALLFNCAQHGPATQNRERRANFQSHLLGRIAFVAQIHPQRALKLRKLFDRIVWPDA